MTIMDARAYTLARWARAGVREGEIITGGTTEAGDEVAATGATEGTGVTGEAAGEEADIIVAEAAEEGVRTGGTTADAS